MLLYHIVLPVKYRREVFTTEKIKEWLIKLCYELWWRYEISFDTIGIDWDHVHFLVQTVPKNSVTKVVTIIKSITWKELIKYKAELKWKLWWNKFWTEWYYANTVWAVAWYQTIKNYVWNQWYGRRWYKTIAWGKNRAMKQMMLILPKA
jgi:REP element-mobilizing transposase RayT